MTAATCVGGAESTDIAELRAAAADYINRGYRPIRVHALGKKPISKAWQNSEPAPHEFQPGDNIGIDLGRSGDLVDVDLDIEFARQLADHPLLFGSHPAFGRQGLRPGHRLVKCADAPRKVTQFDLSRTKEKEALRALGIEKTMVLELRAGGGQTVFPPSRYASDDGAQLIVWSAGRPPSVEPAITWADLQRRAALTAFLSLVAAAYPATGSRDNACLHLGGALVQLGVPPDEADELIFAVAEAAGDEEAQHRRGKATAAAAKIADAQRITGLPTLLRELGMEACEQRIRSWFGLTKSDAPTPLPANAIIANNAEVHVLVSEFADLLSRNSGRVYKRNGELMRLSTLEEPNVQEGVVRHAGLVELRIADPEWLVHEASRCGGHFIETSEIKWRPVTPPRRAASLLTAIADEAPFPVVRGVAMTPTLQRDEPGYDEESKLLLAFPPGAFPIIPAAPTKEDAEAAMQRLEAPIREFPFVDEASRSVARSAMLCAVVRGELRTCPMHIFDAPAAGTGKSKLADVVGIVATGVAPSVVTYSSDDEENEKRLSTILRAGDPVIAVDNISHDLEGDFLCQMLTQESVQARILGKSERVRMLTRTLVLGTGNNVRFRGDIARRVVIARIDANMANPETRQFDFDPVEVVKSNRAQLVVDALTVLRAYRASAEQVALAPFGSFEDWDLVRGALIWLGRADPAQTRVRATADNSMLEERAELFAALYRALGPEGRATVAELETTEALARVLIRLTDKPVFNRRSVGHLLGKHRDNPHAGLTLRSRANGSGINTWWVSGEPDETLVSASTFPSGQDDIPF